MKAQRFLLPILFTIPTILLVVFLRGPLESIENGFTDWKYQWRGERLADTNIVIIYNDDNAVKALGGTIRRNFYALMIKALTDLKAKAIGIDVFFDSPNTVYPEYDDLLATMVGNSGKVVLSSYFKSVTGPDPDGMFHGEEYHPPLAMIGERAASIGHENLGEQFQVPVVIQVGDSLIPAFAFQLLNIYAGGPHAYASLVAQGSVQLNYPGRMTSFVSYPFLEVLKSYDALRRDEPTSVPVGSLKDKIVLVGVVGDGTGKLFETPFDRRFPALGIHAVFIDNALHESFIHDVGFPVVLAVAALVGIFCAISVLFFPPPRSRIFAFVVLVLPVILSLILFFSWNTVLPIGPIFLVGVVALSASFFYTHRLVRAQVDSLTVERTAIIIQLKDRETKVSMLEKELLDISRVRSADRTNELLEEIRKHKSEIRSLSSRADDMEVFEQAEEGDSGGMEKFEELVYAHVGSMKQVIEFIQKIVASDAPVLILGESGTGKELVAQAIHRRGERKEKPFVAVNCGALSESLLESELFGHEKGAFTGAVKDKMGRFELADGGTIFLDEIGEVSEAFQLRLLRVLQEGEFERVGGTKTLKVNVRVLAATNKDLKEQVKARLFREDVYYRLNVLSVALPSLRDRQEDIPLLVRYFLEREEGSLKVSKNVMDSFTNYLWPGNIRELESVIRRAALLARAEKRTMVNMKDLTEELVQAVEGSIAIEEQIMESFREKGFSRSSVSETANELGGLNRGTVAEYLRGQCLQAFAEQGFNVERTVQHISLSADQEVNTRVRKKLLEYINNISDVVDTSQPWEAARLGLKPKTKNLPQRYHPYLEKTAEAFYRGVWKRTGQPSDSEGGSA